MAGGKMFRSRTSKTALTKPQKKAVTTIARRLVDNRIQDNYYFGYIEVAAIPGGPNGSPFQLGLMAAGDNAGQRKGISAMIKKIQMKIKIGNPAAAVPADYIGRNVRFVVIRVNKNDATYQPNFGDFMGNGLAAPEALKFPKLLESVGGAKKDIEVLYDRVVSLNDAGDVDQRILSFTRSYKNPKPIFYEVSNRGPGQLWAIVVRSGGTINNPPALQCTWKLTYEDA